VPPAVAILDYMTIREAVLHFRNFFPELGFLAAGWLAKQYSISYRTAKQSWTGKQGRQGKVQYKRYKFILDRICRAS
jgi:hypothetical protein